MTSSISSRPTTGRPRPWRSLGSCFRCRWTVITSPRTRSVRTGSSTTSACTTIPREGQAVGAIIVAKAEGPFSESQIELLKTFADQALIAIENVRLFKELQARTGELTQSVKKLTALGEVSHALSSTLDVETVLDTIVSHASQLAGDDRVEHRLHVERRAE